MVRGLYLLAGAGALLLCAGAAVGAPAAGELPGKSSAREILSRLALAAWHGIRGSNERALYLEPGAYRDRFCWERPGSGVALTAHRGGTNNFREASLGAYLATLDEADLLECDLAISKDRLLFCAHGPNLAASAALTDDQIAAAGAKSLERLSPCIQDQPEPRRADAAGPSELEGLRGPAGAALEGAATTPATTTAAAAAEELRYILPPSSDWYAPDFDWSATALGTAPAAGELGSAAGGVLPAATLAARKQFLLQEMYAACPGGPSCANATLSAAASRLDRPAAFEELWNLALMGRADGVRPGLYIELKHSLWHSSRRGIDVLELLMEFLSRKRADSPDNTLPLAIYIQSFELTDLLRARSLIDRHFHPNDNICLVALVGERQEAAALPPAPAETLRATSQREDQSKLHESHQTFSSGEMEPPKQATTLTGNGGGNGERGGGAGVAAEGAPAPTPMASASLSAGGGGSTPLQSASAAPGGSAEFLAPLQRPAAVSARPLLSLIWKLLGRGSEPADSETVVLITETPAQRDDAMRSAVVSSEVEAEAAVDLEGQCEEDERSQGEDEEEATIRLSQVERRPTAPRQRRTPNGGSGKAGGSARHDGDAAGDVPFSVMPFGFVSVRRGREATPVLEMHRLLAGSRPRGDCANFNASKYLEADHHSNVWTQRIQPSEPLDVACIADTVALDLNILRKHPQITQHLQKRGLSVHTWTVVTAKDMKDAVDLGVTGLFSDDIKMSRSYLKEIGSVVPGIVKRQKGKSKSVVMSSSGSDQVRFGEF